MSELLGCPSLMIQQSPNRWSCMPTSLAMVLRVPVSDVIAGIGHDGSEIVFPLKNEPECRRGFHTQELVRYCMVRDYWAMTFEAWPTIATTRGQAEINWEDVIPVYTSALAKAQVREAIEAHFDSIFCGITRTGRRHAIARVHDLWICPNQGLLVEGFPNDFKISHILWIGRMR